MGQGLGCEFKGTLRVAQCVLGVLSGLPGPDKVTSAQ